MWIPHDKATLGPGAALVPNTCDEDEENAHFNLNAGVDAELQGAPHT